MNQYNPNIHHRRSIRLKGYDYSQAGAYFITICCQDRIHRFGNVSDGEMKMNVLGQIAYDEWVKLPQRFPNIELDVFQIMPNHMHGILLLKNPPVAAVTAGAGFTPAQNIPNNDAPAQNIPNNDVPAQNIPNNDAPAQNIPNNDASAQNIPNNDVVAQNDDRATARVAPITVGDIIGAYKSLAANGCLEIYKSKNEIMGKLWQRNYWEHIIRNEQSYQNISNYIINNPNNWGKDKFHR